MNWKRAIWTTLLLGSIAAVVIPYFVQVTSLSSYRRGIEREFQREIALIEKHAMVVDENDFENYERVISELKQELSSDAIYWGTWSSDGHHGLDGIHEAHHSSNGYETYAKWYSPYSNSGNHTVYFGRGFDGTPLVSLWGTIPDGTKRYYRLSFYRSKLNPQ